MIDSLISSLRVARARDTTLVHFVSQSLALFTRRKIAAEGRCIDDVSKFVTLGPATGKSVVQQDLYEHRMITTTISESGEMFCAGVFGRLM